MESKPAIVHQKIGDTMSHDHDLELVQKAVLGDQDAFLQLWNKYEKSVMGVLRRLLRYRADEVADFAHDTYVKGFENISKYKGSGSFPGWLCRIATRVFLDDFRKRRGKKSIALDDLPLTKQIAGNEDALLQLVMNKQAFEQMTTREQDVLMLLWDGYSAQEIADRLSLESPDKVYQIQRRFKNASRSHAPKRLRRESSKTATSSE